jgi:hypothetical protein
MAASLPVRECAMPSAKVRAMVPGPIMPQRIGWSELMGNVLFLASVLGWVGDQRRRLPALSNRKLRFAERPTVSVSRWPAVRDSGRSMISGSALAVVA